MRKKLYLRGRVKNRSVVKKLIQYKGVEICHSEQVVLHDVNLTVSPGEMVYFLGRIGSGKSSLIRSFYADIPIASGEAQVLGYNLATLKRRDIPYLRRKEGIVFQDFQLLIDRTIEENLLFVLRATGWKETRTMKEHVRTILEQVDMSRKSYKMPHQLSGGEQQRIVIARALLNSPDIILADEPTGNLDMTTGEEIMELLYSISKTGVSVIVSTHNPQWPVQFPGRNIQFTNGRIKE